MKIRTHISFLFYIKRTKLLKNGEAPIFLKINVGKQNCEFSILKSVKPELWSVEKNGALGNSKEAKEVNNYINHINNQINDHLTAMREDGSVMFCLNINTI